MTTQPKKLIDRITQETIKTLYMARRKLWPDEIVGATDLEIYKELLRENEQLREAMAHIKECLSTRGDETKEQLIAFIDDAKVALTGDGGK